MLKLGASLYQLNNRTIFKYPIDTLVSCHACTDTTKVVAFAISNAKTRTDTVGKLGGVSY